MQTFSGKPDPDPDERRRRLRSGGGVFFTTPGSVPPGAVLAVLLIVAGAVLFLANVGILHIRDIGDYWPVILIIIGATKLYSGRDSPTIVSGCLLVGAGVLLQLSVLDILRLSWNAIWPLALIGAGVLMLLRRNAILVPRFGKGGDAAGSFSLDADATLQEFAIFGGVKRVLQTRNFKGGDLLSVFGGIEIDLRRVQMANSDQPIVIQANAVFGGVQIRVPDNCRVAVRGVAVFGGYEDKTLEPIRENPLAPLLVVTGFASFGGVVVE